MPLWGNYDNAANSDIGVLNQVNQSPANTTARTLLFNNTTANTVVKSAKGAGNVVVGQFFANTAEMRAAQAAPGGAHPQHAGWVLRHEGRGLKAGRVWYETLVAMGSSKSDASDDTYFPDFAIVISSNASSSLLSTRSNVNFTVAATTVPTGGTLQYFWQKNDNGWANVANVAGTYTNNTSPTFTANNALANGNVFRVMIMTAGGNTVYSSNATISYVV